MAKRIYKAADSTAEFMGVDGPYINYLLYLAFGSFGLFLLLLGVGLAVYITIPLILIIAIGGFFLLKRISSKYGTSGIDRELIRNKTVDVIYSDDPNVFKNLTK